MLFCKVSMTISSLIFSVSIKKSTFISPDVQVIRFTAGANPTPLVTISHLFPLLFPELLMSCFRPDRPPPKRPFLYTPLSIKVSSTSATAFVLAEITFNAKNSLPLSGSLLITDTGTLEISLFPTGFTNTKAPGCAAFNANPLDTFKTITSRSLPYQIFFKISVGSFSRFCLTTLPFWMYSLYTQTPAQQQSHSRRPASLLHTKQSPVSARGQGQLSVPTSAHKLFIYVMVLLPKYT